MNSNAQGRRDIFLTAYLRNGRDSHAAARSAGATDKTVRAQAKRFLDNAYIKDKIKTIDDKVIAGSIVDRQYLINKLSSLAETAVDESVRVKCYQELIKMHGFYTATEQNINLNSKSEHTEHKVVTYKALLQLPDNQRTINTVGMDIIDGDALLLQHDDNKDSQVIDNKQD